MWPQPYNICIGHKPITTLRQLLTNVKDKDRPEDRQGAVYKIKCCDCQATHIGRYRSMWLTEHHLQTKHQIDWDSATCLTCFTVFYQRLTSILESWCTNFEQNATEFQSTFTSTVQTTYWQIDSSKADNNRMIRQATTWTDYSTVTNRCFNSF